MLRQECPCEYMKYHVKFSKTTQNYAYVTDLF